jgi:hypothetical protein
MHHAFRHSLPAAFAVTFLVAALGALPAETVTIAVVQNESAPAIAIDMSQTIEDELMGNYFDAGHIVSNTAIRNDGSKFEESNFSVKEAAFGLSDYLVVVSLGYGPAVMKDEAKKLTWAELVSLKWKVVRVQNSLIVAEQSVDVSKIKVTDFDPYKQSRLVADTVGEQTLDAIAKSKTGGENK